MLFVNKQGATISEIVKAFVIAKEVFSLDDIWNEIESLSNTVSALRYKLK